MHASFGSIDTRSLQRAPLHSMDHAGTVYGTIAADFGGQRHVMTLNSNYQDCGVTFEDVVCTCGLDQHVRYGCGCWQYGHNTPMPDALDLDAQHAALYKLANSETPYLDD